MSNEGQTKVGCRSDYRHDLDCVLFLRGENLSVIVESISSRELKTL